MAVEYNELASKLNIYDSSSFFLSKSGITHLLFAFA